MKSCTETAGKYLQINCSRYSDLDDKIMEKMTELGLPMIGGTALEIWAGEFGVPPARKRSDNDLDCISNDRRAINELRSWLSGRIDPEKVKVDCMYVRSHAIAPYIKKVGGVLVMSLPYILWSKLVRGSERDLVDIRWILSRPEVTDDEIAEALEELGVTEAEIELLNKLAEE